MKRKWLYIGLFLAGTVQVLLRCAWENAFYPGVLSEFALSAAIGLIYLHVPNPKRGLRAGATLGTILGFLVGLYVTFNGQGALSTAFGDVALTVVRTAILTMIGGIVIAWSESRFNPRTSV